mmetsp:Transcript_28893/g.66807  ORF Transcript_28893/g.66807 Transcript_28893/m.66807 type:complete len:236 (+) Transcript_28893:1983-2690(+)
MILCRCVWSRMPGSICVRGAALPARCLRGALTPGSSHWLLLPLALVGMSLTGTRVAEVVRLPLLEALLGGSPGALDSERLEPSRVRVTDFSRGLAVAELSRPRLGGSGVAGETTYDTPEPPGLRATVSPSPLDVVSMVRERKEPRSEPLGIPDTFTPTGRPEDPGRRFPSSASSAYGVAATPVEVAVPGRIALLLNMLISEFSESSKLSFDVTPFPRRPLPDSYRSSSRCFLLLL